MVWSLSQVCGEKGCWGFVASEQGEHSHRYALIKFLLFHSSASLYNHLQSIKIDPEDCIIAVTVIADATSLFL